ncbi:YihY/virulence factor BrkB family protein [Ideonella sp. BN130291]|uniref:YihY/virulence factor BrkB family protein n=1 Tax=Ideonella sp. BN130291 TaxID=3112940 RepID=UPI002E26573F|nr:YihY/virulence factor BrkB family protein [Ideonella sp. BN130291]
MTRVEVVKQKARARFEQLPAPVRRWLQVATEGLRLWISQDGTELGASIAFYSLFALAPLLVVGIAIAGAVFGADAARGEIVDQIAGLVGRDAARSIESMIASAWRSDRSGFAAVLGVLTLLVGASGVFAELRKALNRIGRVPVRASAIGTFVRARLIAFALVLGFGFLIVASLLASAALSAVSGWLSRVMPVLAGVLAFSDFALSVCVLAAAFWAFLRWLPDRGPSRRAALVGAIVSSLLFALGKHFIGLYLGRVSTIDSFGAAGSLVVVMLWVYYSSQILLFGAALAWALDGVRAEHPQPAPPEQAVAPPATATPAAGRDAAPTPLSPG